MSRLQLLRGLVNERLSAAAEEIFEAVKKTILVYEEEILLSKREIRRQRRVLQTILKPEIKINKLSADQPQLALSVWDEDFPSDQQQQEHCDQEWSSGLDQDDQEPPQTEKSQEDPPSSQEEEEENTIRFIFTPPYVKNELDQPQSDCLSTTGEGDPLPSTSAELDRTKAEDDDGASSSCSAPEHDDSGEEWRGSVGSQSDDDDSDCQWKKRKGPHKTCRN